MFFAVLANAFSQELKTFVFNSQHYHVLPSAFSADSALMFTKNGGYISRFNLHDGRWIKLTEGYPGIFPLATGEIVNGHPEGKWYFYTVSSYDTSFYVSSIVNFRQGIAEGDHFQFYKDSGMQHYYEIKNNNYHGVYRFYGWRGDLEIEGSYMYGNKSGVWKYLNSGGGLWGIQTFLSEVPRTPRGLLRDIAREEDTSVTFPNGSDYGIVFIPYAEGPWISYDQNGKPALEKTFKDGRVVYVKEYYDGVLIEEGETANEIDFGPPKRGLDPNRRHPYIKKGTWKYYDTSGNLLRTELHE